jgi:hypothetical protein
VLDQQELDAAFSSALYASALSFVLVALTLVIGVRSWRLILILVAAPIVGTVWTTGLAAVTVGELNLISFAFGVLFFGVGIDFGTHLAPLHGATWARHRNRGGRDQCGRRRGVGDRTQRHLCQRRIPVIPADRLLGMAQLGVISSLGMAVAFRGQRHSDPRNAGGLAAQESVGEPG